MHPISGRREIASVQYRGMECYGANGMEASGRNRPYREGAIGAAPVLVLANVSQTGSGIEPLTSSFGSVAMIAKVSRGSPALGSFQRSQMPAKAYGSPPFKAIAWS